MQAYDHDIDIIVDIKKEGHWIYMYVSLSDI